MEASDLPSAGEVFGLITGIGFVGGVGGYIAGAIADFLAPALRVEPHKWAETCAVWAGFGACLYFLYRWIGVV